MCFNCHNQRYFLFPTDTMGTSIVKHACFFSAVLFYKCHNKLQWTDKVLKKNMITVHSSNFNIACILKITCHLSVYYYKSYELIMKKMLIVFSESINNVTLIYTEHIKLLGFFFKNLIAVKFTNYMITQTLCNKILISSHVCKDPTQEVSDESIDVIKCKLHRDISVNKSGPLIPSRRSLSKDLI